MARLIAPALRCLLHELIDYAGTFPPASLPSDKARANYLSYREGPHSFLLRHFVITRSDLELMPDSGAIRFSVISDSDTPRAEAIESKSIVSTPKPTYCEAGPDDLPAVKTMGSFAKIRTGGTAPENVPSVAFLADYLVRCARLQLAFKATAGLHHPLRSEQALTYAPDAPRAMLHGFVNVFMAAAFAWHGTQNLEPVLAEPDTAAFRFGEEARWRDAALTWQQVKQAREQFAHCFGSCSFLEPVHDLQSLGWL